MLLLIKYNLRRKARLLKSTTIPNVRINFSPQVLSTKIRSSRWFRILLYHQCKDLGNNFFLTFPDLTRCRVLEQLSNLEPMLLFALNSSTMESCRTPKIPTSARCPTAGPCSGSRMTWAPSQVQLRPLSSPSVTFATPQSGILLRMASFNQEVCSSGVNSRHLLQL